MSELSSTDKFIRKLRKKLREIERLEISDRSSLNREEIAKIKRKKAIREELSQLLDANVQENGIQEQVECCANSPEKELNGSLENDNSSSGDAPEQLNKFLEQSLLRHRKGISNHPQTIQELTFTNPSKAEMKRSNPEELHNVNDTAQKAENKRPKPDIEEVTARVEKSERKQLIQESSPAKQEAVSQTKLPKNATSAKASREKKWHETPFIYNYLDGHSDVVSCVDLDGDYVVSGSRDTLVQVWCAKTGTPLMNLRGHTNAITCVSLLTAQQSKELYSQMVENDNEEASPRLVISTSVDCCIKLWNIEDGSVLRSIYTFSGITALCYLPTLNSCVIGSEGGKLEVYSLLSEHVHPVASHRAFEGPVSSIKMQSEKLICSSVDGYLSVYVLRESGLCRLYNSDDLLSENGELIDRRSILTTAVAPSSSSDSYLYFGDEGASIKVLTWKQGRIKKIRNHVHEFGQTNAISATHSFLLSSSINIDTGDSSVNVFSLPDLNYLGTLSIAGLGRIVCLAAVEDETTKSLLIAVGGSRLTVIETKGVGCKRSAKKDMALQPKFLSNLTLPAGDTEEESCSSSEEDDQEESNDQLNASRYNSTGSWCQIL